MLARFVYKCKWMLEISTEKPQNFEHLFHSNEPNSKTWVFEGKSRERLVLRLSLFLHRLELFCVQILGWGLPNCFRVVCVALNVGEWVQWQRVSSLLGRLSYFHLHLRISTETLQTFFFSGTIILKIICPQRVERESYHAFLKLQQQHNIHPPTCNHYPWKWALSITASKAVMI